MAKLLEGAPVLLVADVVAASGYYRDQLGFTQVDLFNQPPSFAILGRDEFHLMLAEKARGVEHLPNWKIVDKTNNIYIWVDNADELYAEFQERGAQIDFSIYTTPWGTREFGVQDLDGHDIAFGQVLNK
ncbi:MAG: VOC family protein [Anaerolineales bacterium]|nr:VOC family protein [Anaerolineales bacterium]